MTLTVVNNAPASIDLTHAEKCRAYFVKPFLSKDSW